MKIIEKGSFLQKIIVSLCLVVLLFNIVCPIASQASTLGEVLLLPLTYPIKMIADGVEGTFQYWFVGGPIRTIGVMKDLKDEDARELLKELGIIDNSDEPNMEKHDNFSDKYIKWGKSIKLYKDDDGYEKEDSYNSYLGILLKGISELISNSIFGTSDDDGDTYSRRYNIPVTIYSPEAIFSNKIRAFDINFINTKKTSEKNGDYEYQETTMGILQEHIATWYNALRMLAAAFMLPILIYVGIRIMISSAGEKAKYKEMLMDWVVAMCLLFVMHYIMAFIINITDAITNVVDSGVNTNYIVGVEGSEETEQKGKKTYFQTNLMGLVRFRSEINDMSVSIGYFVMYIMLVAFTVMFTWIYLKRTLMIAFLTLIAPIITLTYPLDKLGDGKSQGFDMWLKEYLFNALIQPFHLILYVVLVGRFSVFSIRWKSNTSNSSFSIFITS